MADRNSELRRQRDLLREHLAWIEREIAAAGEPAEAPLLPPRISSIEPQESLDAEAIMAQYRRPAPAVSGDTRRGCITWFAAAMLFLVLIVAGVYLAYTRLIR